MAQFEDLKISVGCNAVAASKASLLHKRLFESLDDGAGGKLVIDMGSFFVEPRLGFDRADLFRFH